MANNSLLTPLQVLILTSLQRHPMHVYGIRDEVAHLCGWRHNFPKTTVQRTVLKLADHGYLEDCRDSFYWQRLGNRRGNIYQLSKVGKHRLESDILLYSNLLREAKMWGDHYVRLNNNQ